MVEMKPHFMYSLLIISVIHAESRFVVPKYITSRLSSLNGHKSHELQIFEWVMDQANRLQENHHKVATPAVAKCQLKGSSLFGRVPCDDWLFTPRRLSDPNLLKRSFAESV
jgi:hypothetical protein